MSGSFKGARVLGSSLAILNNVYWMAVNPVAANSPQPPQSHWGPLSIPVTTAPIGGHISTSVSLPLTPPGGSHAGAAVSSASARGQNASMHSQLSQPSNLPQKLPSLQLDMTSTVPSITLTTGMIRHGAAATIVVDGRQVSFKNGEQVTAAELVAIEQVQGGRQSLILDAGGSAVGGSLSINKITAPNNSFTVDSLTISKDVVAIDVITGKHSVSLSGDLINYGSIKELGLSAHAAAAISSRDIINESGAIITASGKGPVDLSLSASDSLINAGTISSSGNLQLLAGNMQNHGTLASTSGNVVLSSARGQALTVDNQQGTISATTGGIIANNNGNGVSSITGGDLLSRQVNLQANAGTINLDVNKLTGQLVSSGNAVHVLAATDVLNLGKQSLSGDPTYYNSTGSININGDITVNEDLAIIASGDVIATTNIKNITTTDLSGQGHNITIVAGANVTGSGSDTTNLPTVNPSATATFSGSSGTGGSIKFGSADPSFSISSASTTGAANGGDITLASYGGSVQLPASSTLNASPSGGGLGGVVTVVAPAGITIGGVSNGSSTAAASQVQVFGSQPVLSSGTKIDFSTTGSITSGNRISGDTSNLTVSPIAVASNVAVSSNVQITGGSTVTTSGTIISAGGISIAAKDSLSVGAMSAANGISLVSGHDIIAPGVDLSTARAGVNASDVTLVAGASFTTSGNTINLNGASASGGRIDLTSATIDTRSVGTTGTAGGNVNLIAFNGIDNFGSVTLANTHITTGGAAPNDTSSGGVSGNVMVVANGSDNGLGRSINAMSANIDTSGGMTGTGNIVLASGTMTTGAGVQVDRNSGALNTVFNPSSTNLISEGIASTGANITSSSGTLFLESSQNMSVPGLTGLNSNLAIVTTGSISVATAFNSTNSLSLLSLQNGSISIAANINAAGGLLMVTTQGDIKTTVSGLTLSTTSASGDSGSMAIIAGAPFSFSGNEIVFSPFTGSTANNVDFGSKAIVALTTSSNSGRGGDLTIGAMFGTVSLPGSGLTIQTGGAGAGVNGAVNIGGRFTTVGDINDAGGAIGSGTVNVYSDVRFLNSLTPELGQVFAPVGTSAGSLVYTAHTNLPFGLDISNPGTLSAGNITSPGGSVLVQSSAISVGAIDVSSSGVGGTVQVVFQTGTAPLTIGSAGANNIMSINANAGATGNGGGIDLTEFGTGTLGVNITGASAISFNATAGSGGYFIANVNGALNLGANTLDASPSTSGHGGQVIIDANTLTWAGGGALFIDSSGKTAAGGTVSLVLSGPAPLAIGNTAGGIYLADDGGGGSVTLQATGAAMTFSTGAVSMVSSGDNSGGSLSISAQSIAVAANQTAPVSFVLDGSGKGNGGVFTMTATGSNAITFGSGNGDFQLSAQSGHLGSAAAIVNMSVGGDLNINLASFKTGATSGSADGASFTLVAGTSGLGNLQITGALNAAGVGTGAAGNVDLESDSGSPFIMGSGSPNGLSLAPVLGGLTNGSFTVVNKGGPIEQSVDINRVSNVTYTAGGADGFISVTKSLGSSQTSTLKLTAVGSGRVVVSGNAVADTVKAVSDQGLITMTKLSTNHLTATSDPGLGAITISNSVTGILDVQAAVGRTVAITSTGSIASSGKISSNGNITITSTAKNPATIAINDDLTSSSAVSITSFGAISNAGIITGQTGVTEKSTGDGILQQNNIIAGPTASVTLTAGGSSIIDVAKSTKSGNVANDDISAGKAITLTAAKGEVVVGKIGASQAPATFTSKSLFAFTSGADMIVGNTVSITATGKSNQGNVIFGGSLTTTSPSSKVTVTAAGSLTQAANTSTISGGTVTLLGSTGVNLQGNASSGQKTLTVTAAAGDITIGGGATLTSSTLDAKLTALNNIFDSGSVTAVTGIKIATTGKSATNVLNVSNLQTSQGPISVVGAGQLVQTNAGAVIAAASSTKAKATLLIEASNKVAGTVQIAGALSTSGPGGTVTIAVGSAPTSGKNPYAGSPTIDVQNNGSGKVFADGVTAAIVGPASAPNATLTTKSANLILFSPAAANIITFASGASVLADPPAPNQKGALQLDLTSSLANIKLPLGLISHNGTATINVGGSELAFHAGQAVTAAELVAVEQLQNGAQTIVLNTGGAAVGGEFSLNQLLSPSSHLHIESLTIARGVDATETATVKATVRFNGDITNYGTITATGTGTLSLSTKDLTNEAGALITSATAGSDLKLFASSSLTNQGKISGNGAVNIYSPQLTNSGIVSSSTGDISLISPQGHALIVDNTGGTFSAPAGNFNFNNNGSAASSIAGGDIISKAANLAAGAGTINVNVNQLTGTVNSSGNAVHVQAATNLLSLGRQDLSGDPTFYNSTGSIQLTGDITASEDLTIIARGNITALATCTTISTTDGSGVGHDIVLVAGANVTGSGSDTTSLPPLPPSATASFTGASTSGGSVDLSGASSNLTIVSASTSGNNSGGTVTIAAYSGSGAGTIHLPANSTINASGAGFGLPGNITLVAPTGISIASVISPTKTAGAGDLTVIGSQPVLSSGSTISFNTDGSIASGNRIIGNSAALTASNIMVGGTVNAGGNVQLTTGGDVAVNAVTAGGGLSMASLGSISFAANLAAYGGGVSLVAGKDITGSGASAISTSSGGNGGNVTIVSGAAFTVTGNTLTVTGTSTTGGSISLAGYTVDSRSLGGSTGSGGEVTMVALKNTAGGFVSLTTATIMTGGGSHGGSSGDVTILGGAASGNAVDMTGGKIDTTGGASGTGNITLSAQTPTTLSGQTIDRISGTLNGSFTNAVDVGLTQGNVVAAGLASTGGLVQISSGGTLTLPAMPSATFDLVAIGNTSVVTTGPINTTGSISLLVPIGIDQTKALKIGGDLIAPGGLLLATALGDIVTTKSGVNISTASTTTDGGALTIIAGNNFSFQGNQISYDTSNEGKQTSIDFQTFPINSLTSSSTVGKGGNIFIAEMFNQLDMNVPGLVITATGPAGNGNVLIGGYDAFLPVISFAGGLAGTGIINVSSGILTLQAGFLSPNQITSTFGHSAGVNTFTPPGYAQFPFFYATNPADISTLTTGDLTAPGGTILINSANMTVGNVDASSSSNGGSVRITYSSSVDPLLIGGVSVNSISSIHVDAGGTGKGGQISMTCSDSGTTTITDFSKFTFSTTNGTGANVSISTEGPLVLPAGTMSVSPTGSGMGGSLSISALTLSWPTSGSTPFILDASGNGANAGSVSLSLRTTNAVDIGTGPGQFEFIATGGGGSASLAAYFAPLIVDPAGIKFTPLPNQPAGSISLQGLTIAAAKSVTGPLILNTDGIGTASGGSISLTTYGTQPLVIGTAPGDIEISAQGGVNSVAGGYINIQTAGDLTVNADGLNYHSLNPLAAIAGQNVSSLLYLSAGTFGQAGNLKVIGALTSPYASAGTSDYLVLISNSTTPFVIGGTGPNGTTVAPFVSGTTNGSLTVENNNGSVVQSVDMIGVFSAEYTAGGSGSVTVSKALGDANTSNIRLQAQGTGVVNASGSLTAATVEAFSGGGNITMSKISADHLQAYGPTTTCNISVTNTNTSPLDLQLVQGASIFVTSAGSISNSSAITSGGAVNITSSSKIPEVVDITNAITASGAIKISSAGPIINSASISGKLGVSETSTADNILVEGNLSANASSAITLTSTSGSIVELAANDISAGKSIAMSAAKGSITVGGIGATTAPSTFSAKALNGVTTLGAIKTGTSIVIASAGKISSGNIFVEGNLSVTAAGGTIALSTGGASVLQPVFSSSISASTVTITAPGGIDLEGTTTSTSKTLTVNAAKGDVTIGGSALLGATVANVKITALNNVFDTGSITAATGINISASGKIAGDTVEVGSLLTSAGPIAVVGAGSLVQTNAGAVISAASNSTKTPAAILIEASNKSLGNISIDGKLFTSGTGGKTVTIAVGGAPTSGKNPYTGSSTITVVNLGSGKVFADGSTAAIIGPASGPNATLTANNANLILFSPSASNTITFSSGASVQADPPLSLSATTPVHAGVLEVAPGSALLAAPGPSTTGDLSLSNQSTNVAASQSVFFSNDAVSAISSLSATTTLEGLSTAPLRDQFATIESYRGWMQGQSSMAQSSADGPAWISESEIEGGLIPAALLQNNNGRIKAGAQLVSGSLLVCSSQDQTIETPRSKVFVAKDSLALVIVTSSGTAVYNLHDCRSGAVALLAGTEKINVLPGTCAILSSDSSTFADQNPAQRFTYRRLCERALKGNQKLIKGEFSLLSALGVIQPLKTLINSKELTSRRMSLACLKTAAIMEQLNACGEPFQPVPRREIAAFLGPNNP